MDSQGQDVEPVFLVLHSWTATQQLATEFAAWLDMIYYMVKILLCPKFITAQNLWLISDIFWDWQLIANQNNIIRCHKHPS